MSSEARIALVSDIHGNLHALEQVLEHARHLGTDGVACLGDVATLGPRPRDVLSVIRDETTWRILGNHDEYMSRPELVAEHTDAPIVESAVAWCRSELDQDDLDFIATFQARATIDLGRGRQLLLFHGSPDSNTRDVLSDTPAAELDDVLAGHSAAVLAGGHTHVQMLRQHRGQIVVNPGSVGLPFEAYVSGRPPTIMAHAEYAIVTSRKASVSVTLHRVELDVEELIEQAAQWKVPMGEYLTAQYRRCARA